MTTFRIILPLILFIFPPIMGLVLGPAVLSLASRPAAEGRDAME